MTKPYAIEWRWTRGQFFREWTTYKRYKTERDMNAALNRLRAASYCGIVEYRIAARD